MARIFEESGLRITLPDNGSFRLGDFRGYKRLSGRALSEMDVGWWDEAKQVIYLMEVKDYSTREPAKELLPKLLAKGRDCLVMLHVVWCETGDVSRDLGSELPERCRMEQKLKLFFVLKVGAEGITREALTPMRGTLENHIKAYAELLGIRSIVVILLDHETAIERGLPVALIESGAGPGSGRGAAAG